MYSYDSLNRRVRIQRGGGQLFEFAFDRNGKRASVWNAANSSLASALAYLDGTPVAFRSSGSLHFQHQDYLGTQRLRTSANGAVESTFTSGPFGDAYASSAPDLDWSHFAGTDWDAESNTQHAQFRQYSSIQGRASCFGVEHSPVHLQQQCDLLGRDADWYAIRWRHPLPTWRLAGYTPRYLSFEWNGRNYVCFFRLWRGLRSLWSRLRLESLCGAGLRWGVGHKSCPVPAIQSSPRSLDEPRSLSGQL